MPDSSDKRIKREDEEVVTDKKTATPSSDSAAQIMAGRCPLTKRLQPGAMLMITWVIVEQTIINDQKNLLRNALVRDLQPNLPIRMMSHRARSEEVST